MNLPSARTGQPAFRRNVLLGTATAALLAGAVAVGVVPPSTPAHAELATVSQPVQLPSFADVVEAVSPAVVRIEVEGYRERSQITLSPDFDQFQGTPFEDFFRYFPEFGENGEQLPELMPTSSLGSGFFISGDGYIATNQHVIDGAGKVTVYLNDGTSFPATVIGRDDRTDLALIKVDAPDRDFTYVTFADTDVRIGDWVVAVGSPYGFGGTVTAGIVSGRGRQLSRSNVYDDFLQIDAAVNTGNSGGPAFNLAGEVIGINTAIFSPTGSNIGLAFAVPADVAVDVLDQLRDTGTVARGFLGVQIQPVTPLMANALGLGSATGAIVNGTIAGSPAASSDIKVGDIITAVNGEAVNNSDDLARKIGALQPNSATRLSILRDGQTLETTITLAAIPPDDSAPAQQPDQAPAQPSAESALGLQLQAENGDVIVTEASGAAGNAGIRPGDAIAAVNGTPVATPADVTAAIDAARAAGRDAVLLQVERNEVAAFVAVPF